MSSAEPGERTRVLGVRLAAAGFLVGVGLSARLWLPHAALAPQLPVAPWLEVSSPVLGAAQLALLVGALLACLVPAWQRRAAPLVALALALLVLGDQLRFQPWAWIDTLLLLALCLPRRAPEALSCARLVIGCVYLWSGLHKLNLEFVDTGFPWLVEPLREALPASWEPAVLAGAWAAPVLEALWGAALLSRRWTQLGRLGVVAMHLVILGMVGPWGHDWNAVVWPWNLAMVALVLVLFPGRRGADAPSPAAGAWRPRGALGWVLLVVAGVAPLLHFVGATPGEPGGEWDAYPAFGLYSSSAPSAFFVIPPDAGAQLPEALRALAVARDDGTLQLGADHWTLGALGVPAYPAARIFHGLHRWLTAQPGCERVVLVLHRRGRWSMQRHFDTWAPGARRAQRVQVDAG